MGAELSLRTLSIPPLPAQGEEEDDEEEGEKWEEFSRERKLWRQKELGKALFPSPP